MREIRAFDESAELIGELAPVGDQRRLIDRPLLGEPDERGRRRSDTLNGSGTSLDLLYVNAR